MFIAAPKLWLSGYGLQNGGMEGHDETVRGRRSMPRTAEVAHLEGTVPTSPQSPLPARPPRPYHKCEAALQIEVVAVGHQLRVLKRQINRPASTGARQISTKSSCTRFDGRQAELILRSELLNGTRAELSLSGCRAVTAITRGHREYLSVERPT